VLLYNMRVRKLESDNCVVYSGNRATDRQQHRLMPSPTLVVEA